jgi:uncharacterized membrane protein required for colicin V production
MTAYDWLIIFVGVGLIVFFTFERALRALFGLVVLWAATLLSAVTYREAAYRLQALTGPNRVMWRGILFAIFLVLAFGIGHIVVRLAFPVTKLPKLGALDHVIGFLLGCLIAVIFMSLLVNSIGAMVVEHWISDPNGWVALRTSFLNSGLRPYTSPVLAGYSTLFPMFFQGMPPVLIPQ